MLFLLAHSAIASTGSDLPVSKIVSQISPLLLILSVFYLLIIRPQNLQQKELTKLRSHLKIGDNIVSDSGIIGTIQKINSDSVIITTAAKTAIEIRKDSILNINSKK